MSTKAKLEQAHLLIMQAANGPSLALVKGVASKAALVESLGKLRAATDIIEGLIGV
jgi:hypothetical protein